MAEHLRSATQCQTLSFSWKPVDSQTPWASGRVEASEPKWGSDRCGAKRRPERRTFEWRVCCLSCRCLDVPGTFSEGGPNMSIVARTTRLEHDLLGDKEIPADAYYGVQTA